FGYSLLAFQHGKDGDSDVGVKVLKPAAMWRYPSNPSAMPILKARAQKEGRAFEELCSRINEFVDSEKSLPTYSVRGFRVVTYCRECKCLVLLKTHGDCACYRCHSDLIDE